jgi:ribosomal protein S18 acetylase RimI-like enzyme
MAAHPLDNVIWGALTTRQSHFAQALGTARRFIAEVGPLAAFDWSVPDGYKSLAELVLPGATVGLFLPQPSPIPAPWIVVHEAALSEMVQEDIELPAPALHMVQLADEDIPEMIQLTALTKPGPFEKRTRELGAFFGIRREGRLVAMAGERMKLPGFTEVSAVCTHPDHLGHGYAAALMTKVIEGIRERGETPMLHVLSDNRRAISLYERLGFKQRTALHLAIIRRPE